MGTFLEGLDKACSALQSLATCMSEGNGLKDKISKGHGWSRGRLGMASEGFGYARSILVTLGVRAEGNCTSTTEN